MSAVVDFPARTSPTSDGGQHARRRVLHIINGEDYSGAERAQDLLALGLPEFGFDVEFACTKPDRFAAARQSQATPLLDYPMRGRFDLRPVRALARRVREGRFDLLHTHLPRCALIGRQVSLLTGVPMVHHVQSPAAAETTQRVANLITAGVERTCLVGTAAVIAASGTMASYLRRLRVPAEKIHVVHNGVPALGPLAPRKPAENGAWTLGIVAMFRPRKGLHVLLEALGRLVAEGWPVRLRAIGRFQTPEYEQEIRGQVARLGLDSRIAWSGFTREVDRELAMLDAFVLPSLFGEALPLAMLEAMAAGVPVVSTTVEGIPEAVTDGQDGLLVAPGDAEALADALRKLMRGDVKWQELRESAHRRQAEQFSERAMTAGVAAVYRQVLRIEA